MRNAEIYTKPTCPWCVKAKALLKDHDISYIEFILGVDGVSKEMIEAKIGNGIKVSTVPQIFIDGKYIGGCTELMSFLNT